MRIALACFFLGVALILPFGAVGYFLGQENRDSFWEYKTQYLQETLDNCHMRERLNIR